MKRLFKPFIKTMLKIPAAIILGMLLFSIASARAETIGQGDAVVQLLNLFASCEDPLATANAGKLVNDGISPAEVVATDLHKPLSSLKGWNSPDTTRSLAKMLGSYVASHPDRFPEGLPDARTVTTPLRLGPFFEGLFELYPRPFDLFRKELGKLQPLLDRSWLDAAANNGALHLQQLLLIDRGELRELLLSYQESGDDVAIICLGEAISNYSEALPQIDSGEFSTKTLALLLAGSIGMENPDPEEYLATIETAAGWTNEYPGLIVMLRELRDSSSLSLLEAWRLWQKAEREASVKQLILNPGTGPWMKARFVMRVFPNASLSDAEAVSLIRLLPSEVLVACMKLSKVGKPHDGEVRVARWIASELLSRDDPKQTIK